MRRLFLFSMLFGSAQFRPAHAQLLNTVAVISTETLNFASLAAVLPASATDYLVENDTAPISEDEVRDIEEDEDNIYISSGLLHAPEPVNLGGNGVLKLTRYDNGEQITAHYRRKDGSYDQAELKRLYHAMRCSLTGREIQMSVKLIELLDRVEDKFGKRGLLLLSAYRTHRNNISTPGSARESLHMLGWAADIRIPGYSSARIKSFALKLGVGGVGWYPRSGFTHLDVGRERYWIMSPPRRRRRGLVARRKGLHRPSAHRAPAFKKRTETASARTGAKRTSSRQSSYRR